MLAHLACDGRTVGFLDVAQIQPVWVIWTYVAGQKGEISPHRVRSVGSMFVLGRMLRAKKVTFLGTAPGLRLSYVSPS